MNDEPALRKRAEKWAYMETEGQEQYNVATDAYLAGAREEAEIKDTQIAALESRLADQAKEVSSLRDTALAYGDHTGCRLRSPMGSYAGEDEKYCDCGWTTVRRAIGAKEQAEPGGAG